MKDNVTISIIITAHNYGRYLDECITSCLQQSIQPHQIIYSDNGSDDNSIEIAREHDLLIVMQKNRVGLAGARNYAVNFATGKYLIFVDGDDILAYDYLERMTEVLDDDTVVVYSPMHYFNDKNENIKLQDRNVRSLNMLDKIHIKVKVYFCYFQLV